MSIRTVLLFFILCLNFSVHLEGSSQGSEKSHKKERNHHKKERRQCNKKIHYPLEDCPIDVVIVCHAKDKVSLGYCIKGIRENCKNIGRVIVVSAEKLTDKAEWFNENQFPFTKDEIALAIVKGDKKKVEQFFCGHRKPSWYYQQALKLYSPFIIPDISCNVLVVDADTIFMNSVEFVNESNGGLFCYNTEDKAKIPYMEHAKRLVPCYKRVFPKIYSVCHHMLFQKPILDDLFRTVEEHHGEEFWKAFCHCVDLRANKGASEYEIYFNYAFNHTDQVALRHLRWTNSPHFNQRKLFKKRKYDFVSFHDYLAK